MGVGYRWFGRPLLRFQDSEKAHGRSLSLLRFASGNPLTRLFLKILYKPRISLPIKVFGHQYTHPFGLAAGMDKNAKALIGWETTGLAFVEIGGVTMLEQGGNPKPRMFRAPHAQALVNRMGFNNDGSENGKVEDEEKNEDEGNYEEKNEDDGEGDEKGSGGALALRNGAERDRGIVEEREFSQAQN